MKSVDYSPKAIAIRIHQVAELRKVCLSLAKAKRIETETPGPQSGRQIKS